MPGLTRQEAALRVQHQGGEVMTVVGRNLDYLVVGENPGSKLAKARKLGIKTLNQKEFEAIFLE
jgi:DNA ligase (NAD+)